ncbi:hypothetical protein ACMA46_01735 [Clavibacter sp. Sh2141]|uniref:hypothetical protein n=1 Tax=Clavibacter sp. Sh2141 TaxID=3395374 RepID=UPI0039BC5D79
MSADGTDRGPREPGSAEAGGIGGRIGLLALFVLLFVGMGTLYGVGLYQAAVFGDRDALAVLPMVIAGLVVLGFAPALGLLELRAATDRVRPDGRRARPVRLYVWLGITALAALVHAIASLLAGVPILVVLGFVAAAVGSATTSWILVLRSQAAAAIRRRALRDDDAPTVSMDLDWTEGTARRKWRLIGLVFVVTLVLTVGGSLLLGLFEPQEPAEVIALVLQFSLLAPAFTCLFVSIGAQLSGPTVTTGLSPEDRKTVVRRAAGKGEELAPELEWRAARLAVYSRTLQPFQLAQSGMLIVAVTVPSFLRGDFDGWLLILWVVLLAVFLVMLPIGVVQYRRVARYADAVGPLARAHVAPSATGAATSPAKAEPPR